MKQFDNKSGKRNSLVSEPEFTALYAEDNLSYQLTMKRLFKSLYPCAKLIVADDGIQALREIALNKDIALIILDNQMPGLEGWQVYHKLRETGKRDQFIIFTCSTDDPEKLKKLFPGVNGHFNKPHQMADIVKKLEDCQEFKNNIKIYRNTF